MEMIRKWIKKTKNQKGVTLIELLAVIVILGIIAAIGIPAVVNSRADATTNVIASDKLLIEEAAKQDLVNGLTYAATPGTDTTKFNVTSLLTQLNLSGTSGSVRAVAVDSSNQVQFEDTNGTVLNTYTLNITTGQLN